MKYLVLFIILISSFSCNKNIRTETDGDRVSKNKDQSSQDKQIQKRVKALLSKMTIEDKVGEMTQLSLDMLMVGNPYSIKDPYEFDTEKLQNVLINNRVGSILNNGGHTRPKEEWQDIMNVIQDYATNKKATGIPVLYGIDAIHGSNYVNNATLYPQQINLGCTWNTDLVRKLSAISAYETKAAAIPWVFAPVLDVGRDPLWSRFWETFGEDTHLVSEMGRATFEGLQGDDISNKYSVVGCMKHFIGYSVPMTGKDRTPSYIPERQLREYFIPPFKAAIESGARTVMINSGELNGIPVHADSSLLNGLLRDELGFTGLAVTDWEDIKYLYERHRVAKDYKEAVMIAINAGIDMAMVPIDLEFTHFLIELLKEGSVPMKRIDEAVSRILTVKYELGLFETPIESPKEFVKFNSSEFNDLALQAALESIVLLKNKNNLLPLKANTDILVTGPTAHSLAALNGAWTGTWQGKDQKYDTPNKLTVLDALKQQFSYKVSYLAGSQIDEVLDIESAVAEAKKSDVTVICIGEMPYVELPGNINDLSLPTAQIELVKAIAKTNTSIVLILNEGRPRIIREIEPLADAIIFAGLPGNEGGKAIAQIISGEYNPNGRLTFTYPRYVNDLKLYDHKGTEIKDKHFGSNGFNPQWQFAEGLSYNEYIYTNLRIKSLDNVIFQISIDIKNAGESGKLTIPLFINDKVASITPSLKKLRKFQKVSFNAGEFKSITFDITSKDLQFVGKDNKWISEAGEFEVMLGDQIGTLILK